MLYDSLENGKPDPRGLVDSHCHLLTLRAKKIDPDEALTRFFDAGGTWLLDAGVVLDDWEDRLEFQKRYPRVRYSAGLHPNEVHKVGSWDEARLREQLAHPLCLAVGEIGLDWFRGREFQAEQGEFFRRQLALAREFGLPLIIHDRDADTEILQILREEKWTGGGVFHCFSSDWDFAQKVLDLGFYLSFAGNITFSGAEGIREAAQKVPADRYLVETDAPYLTPVPHRGKANQPLNTVHTAAFVAGLRGVSPGQVVAETAVNFTQVFASRLGSKGN